MEGRTVTVAVVNDYQVIVEGVSRMLAPFADLAIVDRAASRDPAADVDVALLDTYGHPGGGADRVAQLIANGHVREVCVFSFSASHRAVEESLAAGARSFVSKGVDAAQLAEAIRRTARGERVVIALNAPARTGAWPGRDRGLTERESEILALLGHGATNRDLARALGISEHTVKAHLKRVFAKLGFANRAQAAAYVHIDPEFARAGTLAPDEVWAASHLGMQASHGLGRSGEERG